MVENGKYECKNPDDGSTVVLEVIGFNNGQVQMANGWVFNESEFNQVNLGKLQTPARGNNSQITKLDGTVPMDENGMPIMVFPGEEKANRPTTLGTVPVPEAPVNPATSVLDKLLSKSKLERSKLSVEFIMELPSRESISHIFDHFDFDRSDLPEILCPAHKAELYDRFVVAIHEHYFGKQKALMPADNTLELM
jgi:hypothetical protein